MRGRIRPERSERGIALVIALLVLLVLSMLAVVLMTTVTIETKISGHGQRQDTALNLAEAGIAEALGQLRAGNIDLAGNPRAVAQIFNTVPGSVPVLGTDSTAVPTGQPAGHWLNYTSTGRSPDALTVRYRTDASRTVIYKYDPNGSPHLNTTTGGNIYQVISTGVRGAERRRVLGEFIQKPFYVIAKGALVANVPVTLLGTANICGYDHRSDTPTGKGSVGRIGPNGCQNWEKVGGAMPGIWSSSSIDTSGAAHSAGTPGALSNQTGFFEGAWSMFNMTQSEFYSWLGPGQWPQPVNPIGIINLDNDAVLQNKSVNTNYPGGDGEGFLYVDGSLHINGNFTYRGLMYVEGDLDVNGTCWILGGLVVHGNTYVKCANGSLTVLYSGDTITQKITQYGGQFTNISWREL